MSKLKFNSATPLYSSDAKAWQTDQFATAINVLLETNQPLVLFVHGRGKEPEKSLLGGTFTKGMAVLKIERGYGTKVLMFNWDSAFNGFNVFDREVPLSHTEAGAQALGRVLSQVAEFWSAVPGARKMALLVHSMGSIVVQKAVQKGYWPEQPGLFSRVIFSQPDADDTGHAEWLDVLAQKESVFVTLNEDDHVLRRSTDARPTGSHALGLGTDEPLARNAKYVDLTCMGQLGQKDEDHEVFAKAAMNGQVHVCEFFAHALTGQVVQLDPAVNVASIERDVVYRLKSRFEPDAPILKEPALPGD
jgi:esterase/lipase superfamily enzyme